MGRGIGGCDDIFGFGGWGLNVLVGGETAVGMGPGVNFGECLDVDVGVDLGGFEPRVA